MSLCRAGFENKQRKTPHCCNEVLARVSVSFELLSLQMRVDSTFTNPVPLHLWSDDQIFSLQNIRHWLYLELVWLKCESRFIFCRENIWSSDYRKITSKHLRYLKISKEGSVKLHVDEIDHLCVFSHSISLVIWKKKSWQCSQKHTRIHTPL